MTKNLILAVSHNPLPAKLSYFNFHPIEVVSRYSDEQLQEGENYPMVIFVLFETKHL